MSSHSKGFKISAERAARDRDMVNAIREMLGMPKLYGKNRAPRDVERFGGRVWVSRLSDRHPDCASPQSGATVL